LPDVSTISRILATADGRCVQNLRRLCRELIVLRLRTCSLARITLDFDGSVFSTKRHAENSAVGYNKKHKGWRSYYPLFCTIAQTGQVFDLLHRPGNVHDSHDAQAFIASCIDEMRLALPGVIIEVRMDSAFFSMAIVSMLINRAIHFTISVPFERLVELKRKIESRQRWSACGGDIAFFEETWKPKCWDRACRFLFVRTREAVQSKEPIQQDLFIPLEFGYAHKVILTNKTTSAAQVIDFHNRRQHGVYPLQPTCTKSNVSALCGPCTQPKPRVPDGHLRQTAQYHIQAHPTLALPSHRHNPQKHHQQSRKAHRAGRRSHAYRQRRSENRRTLHHLQRNLDNRRLTP